MSLVPTLFDLIHDYSFGLGHHPNSELRNSRYHHGHYSSFANTESLAQLENRRRSLQSRAAEGTISRLQHVGKDGFQVNLDVQHFAPKELTVKIVKGDIVIEGEHEEKEDDHGHIFRRFVRRYTLPKEFDVKDVVSMLSSDGILTIKAPPAAKDDNNERIVHIQHTGPSHLSIKSNVDGKLEK